ncbi:retrovirus-related pol polyprotein from transposon TNT 1-94 [Tanacetum coccineum]
MEVLITAIPSPKRQNRTALSTWLSKLREKRKSLALKAKKESSDEECSTSRSEDEEYAMAVRDFKKFFKRRGRFVRQPRNDKKTFQRSRDDKNSKGDRKCFRCGDPNHLIGECPKLPKDKNQRAFVRGSWSDSGEEDNNKVKDKTCLVAQASSEWIKVADAPKHMTNRKLLLKLKAYNSGNVILVQSSRQHHWKGQICDKKCRVIFSETMIIEITKDGKVIAINGFDMSLPVAVCSGLANPWDPERVCSHGGLITISTLDLLHFITNGDFQPIQQNPKTKLDEVIPFGKQNDDLKKRLAKNNEAKMVIYNALPRKEYERIFMCNTAKDIWKTLLIIHQGNSQVKDNKIDLLVQQYEQFVISEDESIDSAFARFNTIITSLKALDEGYSSNNYVRRFLRALHPKRKTKVTAIEESKDLTSLSLDELIRNLKVHEMIIKKDYKIFKAKVKRKSLPLKAKKESSDEECSAFESEDEEYAMATFQRSRDDKNGKSDRKCFRYGDPNHLIGECPKPPKEKNQRAFVGGSWSDNSEEDDEKVNNETCLVAQASSEICLGVNLEPDEWIKDSRCSKHMTGNRKLFSTYKAYNGGNVIFGSNLRGQICNNKCRVTFSEHDNEITKDGKVMGRGNLLLTTLEYLEASTSYSQNSKAFIILNKHTRKIEESLNVTFDKTPPPSKTSPLVDDDLDEEEAIKVTEKKNLKNVIEDETLEFNEIVNIKESRNHPLENVIGNLNQRTLRSQAQNQSNFFCFISTIEPKNVDEALTDDSWIVAMQEELNQFITNDICELVPQPRNMTIIGTKWVFSNKLDKNGIVSQNKARLVAQSYNQQEGIDYDETYALVARLESIRILLAYAYALDFKLFQMDVKSAFLNGLINEEVYVAQPSGFIDFEKSDHVYKFKNALYGLKQAPKAWYERLKAFLIKHEYKMGMVDNTLFTKKKSSNLIIVQIYVDDIIFSSTCQDMCDEFSKIMHDEFEMSMMGELNFFLRLQIKQMEDGIFFNQSKYIKEMLKKFGLEESKPIETPMSSDTKLTKDEECESVDKTKYQGMIDSLLYLTASRPDIMFSV